MTLGVRTPTKLPVQERLTNHLDEHRHRAGAEEAADDHRNGPARVVLLVEYAGTRDGQPAEVGTAADGWARDAAVVDGRRAERLSTAVEATRVKKAAKRNKCFRDAARKPNKGDKALVA